MTDTFDKKYYLATLRTARSLGMEMIPMWKCAMLMAIVCQFGNNEAFTLSPKFQCERIFIQETYHIEGGEVPDGEFAESLKYYIGKCKAVESDKDPFFQQCAQLIKERYNFKLFF